MVHYFYGFSDYVYPWSASDPDDVPDSSGWLCGWYAFQNLAFCLKIGGLIYGHFCFCFIDDPDCRLS